MKKTEKIVVPVDFSKGMDNLIDYALYIAESLHAVIDFVHVIDNYPQDAMIGAPYAQECLSKESIAVRKKMENLVEDLLERCPGCNGKVLFGNPEARIVTFAEEKKADLIIMGTHGAKGLEKFILGSVAEKVLKRAQCPVLIMNPLKRIC